jgi:aminopeptidase N
MESKATDHFYSDWMNWLQSEFDLQRAMRQDAKRTTHPVVQPMVSVEQAAFDDITYRKGRAVIRMLENLVGPQAFQAGVQAYMKRYGYRNTVTDNLWDELEKASGKKIKEIAVDFTTKPGIPLIVVENEAAGAAAVTVNVRQKRFGVDESANEPTEWKVPVYASAAGSSAAPVQGIVKGDQTATISVPGSPPIKLNAGQIVYYRVKYGSAFPELAKAFGRIVPADQLGLLQMLVERPCGSAGRFPYDCELGRRPAVSFFGGFRTPALVPRQARVGGIRNPSQNLPSRRLWNVGEVGVTFNRKLPAGVL